jgi:ribonuclease inhibitor
MKNPEETRSGFHSNILVVEIDGKRIRSESDFHQMMFEKLDFPAYYGRNLSALWEMLSGNLPQPCRLVWKDADVSKAALGKVFDDIIEIMEEARSQYASWGREDLFNYEIQGLKK